MKRLFILSFVLLSCASSPKKLDYTNNSKRDVIKEVLSSVKEEMAQCYGEGESSQKKNHFVAKFQIISTGLVKNLTFLKSELDQKTEVCLKKELLGLSFPKPHDGGIVELIQPFNFFPSK